MVTTHALAGMLVGLTLAPLAPAETGTVVASGAVGGLVPDLDVLADHRKDLHFPVYGALLAGLVVVVAVLTRLPWTVAAAAFLGGAALHAVSDVFGGGRSLRAWAESVDRAVYCHAQDRWWQPRAWIPYDGSLPDFALAAALAVLVFLASPAPGVRVPAFVLVAVSVPYVLVRRRLPEYLDRLNRLVRSALDTETFGRGR